MNLLIPFVAAVMWVGVGIATVVQLGVKQPSTPQKVVIENLGDLTGREKRANDLNERLSAIENQLKQLGKTSSGPAVRNSQSRQSAKRKTGAH